MVDNYAAFFNCTPVGRASDYDGPDLKLFILVGWGQATDKKLRPQPTKMNSFKSGPS